MKNNNKNKETIEVLLPLGRLLRSPQCTLTLSGPDLQAVNAKIDQLQEFLTLLNKDELFVVAPTDVDEVAEDVNQDGT